MYNYNKTIYGVINYSAVENFLKKKVNHAFRFFYRIIRSYV